MVLGTNNDPLLLPVVYNTLKQHLDNLKSEYEKIPKPSRFLGGHDLNTRGNDLIDIKRIWIKEKMEMVNLLLQKIPDDAQTKSNDMAEEVYARERNPKPHDKYTFELEEFKPIDGGRRCKRTGKKRTGVSGKKRGRRTNKKRKSTTRRK